MFKPFENLIDRGQRLQFDVCLDLAACREIKALGHILTCAHKRAAHSDSTELVVAALTAGNRISPFRSWATPSYSPIHTDPSPVS